MVKTVRSRNIHNSRGFDDAITADLWFMLLLPLVLVVLSVGVVSRSCCRGGVDVIADALKLLKLLLLDLLLFFLDDERAIGSKKFLDCCLNSLFG